MSSVGREEASLSAKRFFNKDKLETRRKKTKKVVLLPALREYLADSRQHTVRLCLAGLLSSQRSRLRLPPTRLRPTSSGSRCCCAASPICAVFVPWSIAVACATCCAPSL